MPYKKFAPADIAEMRKKRYLGHHTICEKWREVWRIGKSLDSIKSENLTQESLLSIANDLMLKAREGMVLGKHMHEKLKEYKSYRESGVNQEDESLKEE